MTAPIASLAARTCLAVVSAARTIMSSNFSRLSPDDVAIRLTPRSSWHRAHDRACKNQTVHPLHLPTCGADCLHRQVYAILRQCQIIIFSRADRTSIHLLQGPTMTQERHSGKNGLEVLAGTVKTASGKGPPPVHLWNPAYCGEIDMRIAADGTWFYQETPIGRLALVKLFASVLKREDDRYYLVTPVEKCGIVVDDAPFMAVEVRSEAGPGLTFRTNVCDEVVCGPDDSL